MNQDESGREHMRSRLPFSELNPRFWVYIYLGNNVAYNFAVVKESRALQVVPLGLDMKFEMDVFTFKMLRITTFTLTFFMHYKLSH